MMSIVIGILVAGYVSVCAMLFVFQRSLIYHPVPASIAGNTTVLPIDGERILVSALERPGDEALVYFGGNGEDVTPSLAPLAAAFPRKSIYLMHYRGYGGSSGTPTEAALLGDALVLFDMVHARHPTVAVIGRSLGSGVAVHVASTRAATRLVLVTPYDSLEGIASMQYPWAPVRWLLRDRFDSWRYASVVRVPTLLLGAEFDEVIPRWSTEKLLTRFPSGVCQITWLARATHNSIASDPDYMRLLSQFIS